MPGQAPGGTEVASRVRKLNGPSVPVPVRSYWPVTAPGCRPIGLETEVPENDNLTVTFCALRLATPRLSISATVVVRVPIRFMNCLHAGRDRYDFCSPSPVQAATDSQKRPRSCIIKPHGKRG